MPGLAAPAARTPLTIRCSSLRDVDHGAFVARRERRTCALDAWRRGGSGPASRRRTDRERPTKTPSASAESAAEHEGATSEKRNGENSSNKRSASGENGSHQESNFQEASVTNGTETESHSRSEAEPAGEVADDEVDEAGNEEGDGKDSADKADRLSESNAGIAFGDDGEPLLWSASLAEYADRRASGLTPRLDPALDSEFSDAWALAVQERKAFELKNQYSRVGILADLNFPDFVPVPGKEENAANASLEQLSRAKAKAVYNATGLPSVTETHELIIDAPESGASINKTLQKAYHTRAVEEEGDDMIERVRPVSDHDRLTHFICIAAYFDGEFDMVANGTAEVAMYFSGSKYASVAVASAMDELYMTLTRVLGLELVPPGGPSRDPEQGEKEPLVGATLLRERILREAEMLDNSILKVSSFLNHKVDAELMEACGVELAERLRHTAPTKILTVESTGLIPGLPTARCLGVPLVFARKSRPITISDSFQTSYRSATKGTTSELVVSCEYLSPGDRVVVIDDFLAGGSTAEALFKLANMAHAKVVGVGVLIEKMSDGGRAFLSGYDVPVESLAKVLPAMEAGRVDVVEELPWVSQEDVVGEQVDVTSSRIRDARRIAAERTHATASARSSGDGDSENVISSDDEQVAVSLRSDRVDDSDSSILSDDGTEADDDELDGLGVVDTPEHDDFDDFDDLDELQETLLRPRPSR